MSADNLPRPATAGPWGWFGRTSGPIRLATRDRGRTWVMDFVRHGMRGAQPRFQNETGMVKASELSVPEVDYRDDIAEIDHPDAKAIAALPDWINLADERGRKLDAVRDYCERRLPACSEKELDSFDLGEANACAEILTLLDGEATDGE